MKSEYYMNPWVYRLVNLIMYGIFRPYNQNPRTVQSNRCPAELSFRHFYPPSYKIRARSCGNWARQIAKHCITFVGYLPHRSGGTKFWFNWPTHIIVKTVVGWTRWAKFHTFSPIIIKSSGAFNGFLGDTTATLHYISIGALVFGHHQIHHSCL